MRHNMPGFMQVKVQKGDFLKKPSWECPNWIITLSFYVTKTFLVGPKWFWSDQIDLDLPIMISSWPKWICHVQLLMQSCWMHSTTTWTINVREFICKILCLPPQPSSSKILLPHAWSRLSAWMHFDTWKDNIGLLNKVLLKSALLGILSFRPFWAVMANVIH